MAKKKTKPEKKKGTALPWRITAAVLAVALIAVSCTWVITGYGRHPLL